MSHVSSITGYSTFYKNQEFDLKFGDYVNKLETLLENMGDIVYKYGKERFGVSEKRKKTAE